MGYLEGLSRSSFDEDKNGNIIFYPYGVFGSGYIITHEQQIRIKRNMKIFYATILPLWVICILYFGLFSLLGLIIFYPIYALINKKTTKGCAEVSQRLSFLRAIQNSAEGMGPIITVLLLSCGIVMTSAAVFVMFAFNKVLLGITGGLFFGLGTVVSLYQFIYLIKGHRNS